MFDSTLFLEPAAGWVALAIDVVLKASLILTFAALGALLLQRASAAMRHFVWSTAIVLILALPFLAAVVPAWYVPVLPEHSALVQAVAPAPEMPVLAPVPPAAPIPPFASVPPVPPVPPVAPVPPVPPVPPVAPMPSTAPVPPLPAVTPPVAPIPSSDLFPPGLEPEESALEGVQAAGGSSLLAGAVQGSSGGSSNAVASLSAWGWLLLLWATGVLAVFLRWMIGTLCVAWMGRRATSLADQEWLDLLQDLSDGLGLKRPVVLLQSRWATMPMTWGVLRPRILLPAEASDWPATRRRIVLLHELAHIERWDNLTQASAQAVCALHWFNPLVWFAARQLRVERERACDDLVLTAGTKASDYAGHVLDIARTFRSTRLAALSTVSMAHRSQLEGRLLAILNPQLSRRALSRLTTRLMWIAALFVVLPLAAMRPWTETEREVEPPKAEETASILAAVPAPEATEPKDSTAPPLADDPEADDPEIVIVYPGPEASLTDRWVWAKREAEAQGLDGRIWIGYSIERRMGESEYVGSMDWSNNGIRTNGTPLREIITGERQSRSLNALGGSSDREAIKDLAFLFDVDPSGDVREVEMSNLELSVDIKSRPFIWLGESDDAPSRSFLAGLFETATDDLKEELVAAYAMHDDNEAVITLLGEVLQSDEATEIREAAAFWLGQQDDPQALAILEQTVRSDRSDDVREQAVFGISQTEMDEATDLLIDLARNAETQGVREQATFWLGQKASEKAAEALTDLAFDDDAPRRSAEASQRSAEATQRSAEESQRSAEAAERSMTVSVRRQTAVSDSTAEKLALMKQAVHALAQLDDGAGTSRLIEIARTHPNPEIRADAVFWLGQAESAEAVEALEDFAFNGETVELQKKALHALAQLDDEQGAATLISIARTHPDDEMRADALFWISQTDSDEAADLLNEFALEAEDIELQKRAVHGLSQLDEDQGVRRLIDIAERHPNEEIRGDAVFWLGQTEGEEASQALRRFAFDDSNPDVRKKAVHALSQLDDSAGVTALVAIAREHPDDELRGEALFWLGQTDAVEETAQVLREFAFDEIDPELQKKAVYALSQLDDDLGAPILIDVIRTHPNAETRMDAVFWLGQTESAEAVNVLNDLIFNEENEEVLDRAVHALSQIDREEAITSLIDIAQRHPNPSVRKQAVFWLGESGDPRALDTLVDILRQDQE